MNRIESDPRAMAGFAKRSIGLALALWLGGGATLAAAVTCSVSTAGVAFGPYDVFASSAVNVSGTLTASCTFQAGVDKGSTTVPYTISLSTGSSNSFVQRQMKSGTYVLGYNLYTSNAYSNVWGDTTGSTSTVSGSLTVNPGHPTASNQHTVYGQIPALQDAGVAPDYKDNVTATMTY